MKKLTCVVIGCGNIARVHLDTLADLKHVEVASVCDISAAKAEATAERFGIKKWYTNYQDMLADFHPDMVHITTTPSSHFAIAKYCLSAGRNVLCEKPIVSDHHEFCTLKKLALANRCMLMENQNLRFHSSIQRLESLLKAGKFGEILDVQLSFSLNITNLRGPYADTNVPHYGQYLRGGVIGDFLPHIAYLTYIFTGAILQLRTIWEKRSNVSALLTDEFRCIIKGERSTAYVAFSGNARPEGYWLRVLGTRMYAEVNLSEPRRLTIRRLRAGEPALMKLVDGIVETRDVLIDTIASFWSKLGAQPYGLSDLIVRTYRALELGQPQPIALDEIEDVVRLVDSFTDPELML